MLCPCCDKNLDGTYVGLNIIECKNPECKKYSPRVSIKPQEVQEMNSCNTVEITDSVDRQYIEKYLELSSKKDKTIAYWTDDIRVKAESQEISDEDKAITGYINSLPWSTASDYEKTIVAGNIRSFASWYKEYLATEMAVEMREFQDSLCYVGYSSIGAKILQHYAKEDAELMKVLHDSSSEIVESPVESLNEAAFGTFFHYGVDDAE